MLKDKSLRERFVDRINKKNNNPEKLHKVRSEFEVEDSIVFRVMVTITVVIAIASTILVSEDGLFLGLTTIGLTIFGSYISYLRRRSKNWWIKIIISLSMLLTFGDFIRNVISNPYDARIPLANLLIWLQVLHSYDLPRRRDINYSILVALILISVTATISRDLVFGIFLLAYIVFSLLSMLYNNLSQHNIYRLEIKRKTVLKIGLPTIAVTLVGMIVAFVFMPRYQTMKIKTLPISVKLPEIPNYNGQINNKTSKSVKEEIKDGKKVLSVQRNFNKDAYYGFSTELDLNFRGQLSDEIIMKVRSSEESYWRGMAFDSYNGKVWTMTKPYDTKKLFSNAPPIYTRMSLQVNKELTRKHELVQTYYIEKELSNLVFAAQYAEEVYYPSNYVMVDNYGSIRSPVELDEGLTYSVVSRVPEFDMKKLTKSYSQTALNKVKVPDTYLQTPQLSGRVIKLTQDITKNAKNNYERMVLLKNYLQKTYPYDLNIPEFPENVENIDYFLFEQKKGYCEHFATSLAVMARSLGIPTRLVTGFVSGKYNPITGYYEVKSSDAHAWVEAYFPYQGWVPFDPTPGYVGNLLQNDKNDTFIFSSVLKELWNSILQKIPESWKNFFGNTVKLVLNNLFTFFANVISWFSRLNWIAFVGIISFIIISLMITVFIRSIFKNLSFKREKEQNLLKRYSDPARIEIVKIQDNLVHKLQKLGYEYHQDLTLKEYLDKISSLTPENKGHLRDISNKLYFARYSNEKISSEYINQCKKEIEVLLTKLENKVPLTKK